jgi:predicted RNase H-like HicB family nuclease
MLPYYGRNYATQRGMSHPTLAMSDRKPQQSVRSRNVQFRFEIDRETDGRWIAEIPEVPGALAYGTTENEAKHKAYALALYAIADAVERESRDIPESISVMSAIA